MSFLRDSVVLLLCLLPLAVLSASSTPDISYAERHLSAALNHKQAGQLDEARQEFFRVLERDAGNFQAMAGLVEVARERRDHDEEVFFLHAYVNKASKIKRLDRTERDRLRRFQKALAEADPYLGKVESYRKAHLRRLLMLGFEHLKKGRFHVAKTIFEEVIHLSPNSEEAKEAFHRIETEGGNELAVERPQGVEDLFSDVTQEWIQKQNALHNIWDKAWKKKLENFTVITDAGYEVLEVLSVALDQMDGFYRVFYDHKVKGGNLPHIQVKVFKDRDEFMLIGKPNVDWAAGYYNGSAIVMYDPRGSQAGDARSDQEPSRSMRGMIQTMAHELSHHFVSIAKGGGLPGWFNEGLASFFEGTRLLSNGKVKWNLVAAHRLRPLVDYLKSSGSPKLADVIACKVDDYRVFYPYGWGLVYFMYNYENAEGEYPYRKILNEYRELYVGGVDHLERFELFIIEKAAIPGIATFEDFEATFRDFIFQVNEEYMGRSEVGLKYLARADAFMAVEKFEQAQLFYEKALNKIEDDPNILWKLAVVLEVLGEIDRAIGTYRSFINSSEFHGIGDDPRIADAKEKIEKLDPLADRFKKVRTQFEADVLAVAKGYRDAELYMMALVTARELAVADNPSILARDFYLDIEEQCGKTLEMWQVAFNERDLKGWYGEDVSGQFRVDGDRLLGHVTDADLPEELRKGPLTGGAKARQESTIPYKIFFLDREIRGDFSLDAEIRTVSGCDLYGLCFGARSTDAFQALLLKHDGNLDISTFDGAWFIRRHIPTFIDPSEWNRLRVDIRGNVLKVSLNDQLVEELEYDGAAQLRGDVGILVGRGDAEYRNIRFLERNWRLPYRRITREFTRSFSVIDRIERDAPGKLYYRGQHPPALTALTWRNGEPVSLDELMGKVVVLAFWAIHQEQALPTLPLFEKLQKDYGHLDFKLLLVTNDKLNVLERYLETHHISHHIAVDLRDRTIKSYAIEKVGLPHLKLIDLDGTVVWEGNPDWSRKHGSYLDQPLKELVKARGLKAIAAYRKEFPRAREALEAGRYKQAYEVYRKFERLDPAHPDVRFAQAELSKLRDAVDEIFERARERIDRANFAGAMDLLKLLVNDFPMGQREAEIEAAAIELEADAFYKDCRWIEHRFEAALEAYDDGELDRFKKLLSKVAGRLERVVTRDGGLRGSEYRLALDWLTGKQESSDRSFAEAFVRMRSIRQGLETVEALAASQRPDAARRLCAEVMAEASGTTFESEALKLLDML